MVRGQGSSQPVHVWSEDGKINRVEASLSAAVQALFETERQPGARTQLYKALRSQQTAVLHTPAAGICHFSKLLPGTRVRILQQTGSGATTAERTMTGLYVQAVTTYVPRGSLQALTSLNRAGQQGARTVTSVPHALPPLAVPPVLGDYPDSVREIWEEFGITRFEASLFSFADDKTCVSC